MTGERHRPDEDVPHTGAGVADKAPKGDVDSVVVQPITSGTVNRFDGLNEVEIGWKTGGGADIE